MKLVFIYFLLGVSLAFSHKVRVSGEKAKNGQFPYQVSIRDYYSYHHCGGVILDATTVLTAASCCDDRNVFTIAVGNNNLDEQTIYVANNPCIKHDDYNRTTKINDIAIYKLPHLIKFAPGIVEPVKLPKANIDTTQINSVTAAGWGRFGEEMDLRFINVKTISNEECAKLHGDAVILDGQLCTFDGEDKHVCKRDYGGPLVDEHKQLVGLISWGKANCLVPNESPDVYTRIFSYLDWIEEHLH